MKIMQLFKLRLVEWGPGTQGILREIAATFINHLTHLLFLCIAVKRNIPGHSIVKAPIFAGALLLALTSTQIFADQVCTTYLILSSLLLTQRAP